MNRGLVFGKFMPLHRGHIRIINESATLCDHLDIVISYSDAVQKELLQTMGVNREINKKHILRWMRETYKELNHISVYLVDESDIPSFPLGWPQWANRVIKTIGHSPDFIFSSEKEHIVSEQYFPNSKHMLIDSNRINVPISATQMREEGIYRHWEYLAGICRPFFVFKVAIVGTESTGKTTLCRYLAKHYATSWVSEIGKEYVYDYCGGSEDNLMFEDYGRMALFHKLAEEKAYRNSNKLTILDTEGIVTQYYCRLYEGKSDPVTDSLIKNRQDYDLWIHLPPDVEWVDDGLRSMGDPEQRHRNDALLRKMLAEYGINQYYSLAGNYNDRLKQAIALIDLKMNN